MLTESQLRQFEQHLIDLGGERAHLEKEHIPMVSVYDLSKNIAQNQQNVLQNIIKNALLEKDVTIDDEKEELEYEIAQASDEDELAEILEDGEYLEGAGVADSLDNSDVSSFQIEEIDDLAEIEQAAGEWAEEDVPAEGAQETQEISAGYFTLPQKYQTLDQSFGKTPALLPYEQIFSSFGSSIAVKETEDELMQLQKEVSSDTERFNTSNEYKSIRQFSEEDEKIFFENIDKYNIIIKKSAAAILKNEDISYFSERLVNLILDEASPQTVLRECEKLLGTALPRLQDFAVYNKEELSQRLITRAELVRKSAKIISTKIVPIVIAAAAAVFFGFFFIIQPMRAVIYYQLGFAALKKQNYEDSEARFIKGADTWSIKAFYFEYADEYEKQHRYTDAKKKYLQLVFGLNEELRNYLKNLVMEDNVLTNATVNERLVSAQELINYSREGFSRLAAFTKDAEGNFAEAEKYYNAWLFKYPKDSGVYMEKAGAIIDWYDAEKDPNLLGHAQRAYDTAANLRSRDDTSLISRLRYAIRAGDEDYIKKVSTSIVFAPKYYKPKFILLPYTELAIYKLEQGDPSFTADILDEIKKYAPGYIHLNYLYAQYYRGAGDQTQHLTALQNAQKVYNQLPLLRGKSLYYALETDVDLGGALLNREDNVAAAKQELLKVQEKYESLGSDLPEPYRTVLARLYVLQAAAAVLEEKIPLAREYLLQAQERNYNSPDMKYQQGVVEYLSKNYYQSAQNFINLIEKYNLEARPKDSVILDGVSENFSHKLQHRNFDQKQIENNRTDVFLAAANALYLSGNYSAAALHYERALETMDETIRILQNTNISALSIKPDIYKKAQNIVYAKNNFGAALYELSRTQETQQLRARAVHELTDASIIMQNTYRSNTGTRILAPDVPQANISAIVHNNAKLRIYSGILLSLSSIVPRYYNLKPISRS